MLPEEVTQPDDPGAGGGGGEEEVVDEPRAMDDMIASSMPFGRQSNPIEDETKATDEQKAIANLQMENAITRDVETAGDLMPSATKAEKQKFVEAGYKRDWTTIIKMVRNADKRQGEKDSRDGDPSKLDIEGTSTDRTGGGGDKIKKMSGLEQMNKGLRALWGK